MIDSLFGEQCVKAPEVAALELTVALEVVVCLSQRFGFDLARTALHVPTVSRMNYKRFCFIIANIVRKSTDATISPLLLAH